MGKQYMRTQFVNGIILAGLAGPASALALSLDFVTVGLPGNASDPANNASVPGIGAVGNAFGMGTYEVSNSQYAEFLNSVDSLGANALALFNTGMMNDARGGILFTPAASTGAKFSIKAGYENLPVVYVTFFGAARFTNWLHNGQGNSSTESGAYTLLGGTPTPSNANTLTRNSGAQFWVPSENEWFKAAYYQPSTLGGDADNYWLYPMQTNLQPFSAHPLGATPSNSRAGNFFSFDSIANGYDEGYALTSSPSFITSQNYLIRVGAYTQARSFFGTFDQGGNVSEWNDTMDASASRGVRGGSWGGNTVDLRASSRGFLDASGAGNVLGFRVATVATVPEPTVVGLSIVGGLCLASRRKRRA